MEKSSKKEFNGILHCVILAAGMGTRMKSSKSKVLHEVSGIPMVQIVLEVARSLNANITVIVSEENRTSIELLLKDNEKTVLQEERLGTGHAVLMAREQIEKSDAQKVLILYGDTPLVTLETIQKMVQIPKDLIFLGFLEKDTTNKYGRLVTSDENLLEIVEYKDANAQQREINLCNSGVVCVEKSFLLEALNRLNPSKITGEYYLTDLALIGNTMNKKCGFIVCEKEEVLGVNSRDDLAVVDDIMQKRIKSLHMKNGVTFLLPQTTYIHFNAKIGQDVIIEPNCFIGKNVEIGNVVRVRASSYLEGCVLMDNVIVGPFARIREGTILETGVILGNFVEVKNSHFGKNTKAGHLSYIGDSSIGSGVNIGGGTIFCNYDGFKKYHTTVENNVFIGSNSTIVSPVEIKDGTLVGAGSVVTKSTEKDSMIITRAEEKSIPNGAKKFREKRSK